MEDKGTLQVCIYSKLRELYYITPGKTYLVIDVKNYGAFPTYVIEDDRGDIKEINSILFISLKRYREIKLEKLGI
jgi:hypothetical protein